MEDLGWTFGQAGRWVFTTIPKTISEGLTDEKVYCGQESTYIETWQHITHRSQVGLEELATIGVSCIMLERCELTSSA